MPGMGDMARMMAAGGGDGGGGMSGDGGSPDLEAQDPNAPEDGPEQAGGDPAEMIEDCVQQIMAAAEQLPGDLGEKARKHAEGLMEIAQQAEAAGGGAAEEGAGGQEPSPDGQSDQVEGTGQGGGAVGGSPVSYGA